MPPRHVAIGSISWGMEKEQHRTELARLRAERLKAAKAHREAIATARARVTEERAQLKQRIDALKAKLRGAAKKKRAKLEARIRALMVATRAEIKRRAAELLARARADRKAEGSTRRELGRAIAREHAEAAAAEKARHAEAAAAFRRTWAKKLSARDAEAYEKKRGKYSPNAELYRSRKLRRRLEELRLHPERQSWAEKWGEVSGNIDAAIGNGDAPRGLAILWRRYRHKKPKGYNDLTAQQIFERQIEAAAESEELGRLEVDDAERRERSTERGASRFLAHYEAHVRAIDADRDRCRSTGGGHCDGTAERQRDEADAAAIHCEHADDPIACFEDELAPPF